VGWKLEEKRERADAQIACNPPSPEQPTPESPDAMGASVPQRSHSDPLPRRSTRLTFRAVAQSIMKVLTLQRGNSNET